MNFKSYGFIKKLQEYVKQWIENVDTSNVKCNKKSLMNSDDYFFTFNYTDVLEKVYKAKNVLHIHGGVKGVSKIEPIMGHCNLQDIQKHRQWAKEAMDEGSEAEASILDAVADYLQEIYKDTNKQIELNSNFFKNIRDISNVIIIGWSAGDVDIPYLKEIIKHVSKNTRWTVYWYDSEAYNSLKKAFDDEGIRDKATIEYIQSDAFWD